MSETLFTQSESTTAVKKKRRTIPILLIALLSFLALALLAFVTLRPIQVLPYITIGPGFALVNQDGAQLTNEDLRGSVVLYNFTYASCQPPCPETGRIMQQVQNRLTELDTAEIPVRLVTISFDPQRDTPEALRAYAATLHADPHIWSFLTGTPDRLKWLISGGFGVAYQEGENGDFTFDPAFMLVDGAGVLRAEYRTDEPDVDHILRDIQLVTAEAKNRQGAANYAYEAAHLFLCYPR